MAVEIAKLQTILHTILEEIVKQKGAVEVEEFDKIIDKATGRDVSLRCALSNVLTSTGLVKSRLVYEITEDGRRSLETEKKAKEKRVSDQESLMKLAADVIVKECASLLFEAGPLSEEEAETIIRTAAEIYHEPRASADDTRREMASLVREMVVTTLAQRKGPSDHRLPKPLHRWPG